MNKIRIDVIQQQEQLIREEAQEKEKEVCVCVWGGGGVYM